MRLEKARDGAIKVGRSPEGQKKKFPAYLTCTVRSSHGSVGEKCGCLQHQLEMAVPPRMRQISLPAISSESLPRVRLTALSTTRLESCGANGSDASGDILEEL